LKALKILLWLFLVLIAVLIMIVGVGLNSESFLNKAAKIGIEKSGVDIKFDMIRGGLFSGLEVRGFNYQGGDVQADLRLDIDFLALQEGVLRVNEVNLSHLRVDKAFLSSLLAADDKKSREKETQESFIKEIIIDRLHLDTEDIAYESYLLHYLQLDVNNFYYDMKERFDGDIKADIDSNVGKFTLHTTVKKSHYDSHLDADIASAFISPYLKDSNLTLGKVPHISLDAKGDFKALFVDIAIQEGALSFNEIGIRPQNIMIASDIGLESGEIKTKIDGKVDSDVAGVDFTLGSHFNHKDINATLVFDLQTDIEGREGYLKHLLKDKNVTITTMPKLHIKAEGDFKEVIVNSRLDEGKMAIDGIEIAPKKFDIDAKYNLKKSSLDTSLQALVNSNVAVLDLASDVSVNLEDINKTLHYESSGKIKALPEYLKSQMHDVNITMDTLSPLTFEVVGDAKALDATVDLDGKMRYGELLIEPKITSTKAHFDLVTKALSSQLHLLVDTNKGALRINADVKANVEDLNETLSYKADMTVKDAKAYAGVDLSEIGDMEIRVEGTLKALQAAVDSKKIDVDISSSDFDTFDFSLDTKKIYIGKIYDAIAADLKKSFVALRSAGYYRLSSREGEIKSQLKGFKYNRHTLYTNRFNLQIKGEDIILSPLILRSDNFKVQMDMKKVGKDLVAHVKNRAFFAKAKVLLEPLNVHADGEISSIEALLKEVDKIYPVNTKMGIDGRVVFKARMQGERVKAEIHSPKITLKEGRLEQLHLLALYAPNKVLIKNFDFKLAGFEGKGMNRAVKLARDGVIIFDGENASIDLELENLLLFKGKKEGDVTTGIFKTKTLALAYPGYGETKVTTDLEIYESAGKMAVTGEVRFRETEINYQSPFLDISKDDDIIIISKKDKEKKVNDNFLQNTFLDIKVVSDDEMLYKVDDGEIELQPNIVIRKDFGQAQKIMGKIKILDGMYDFADKRFKIKEGAIAFRGLAEVNPLLDLHVEYDEIEDITIMIDIGGDKNRPKLTFSSIPQKSKKDIFSYLLFGMSASETEGAATSANKAAEKIFGRAVAKDLARELHLDRLDMNRNADGGIDIKAGKKVKRKMIIYYQNKSTESSFIVEKKLSKNWEVDAEVGKLGQAIDFVYRKGFK
jgi:hypothetical protein